MEPIHVALYHQIFRTLEPPELQQLFELTFARRDDMRSIRRQRRQRFLSY